MIHKVAVKNFKAFDHFECSLTKDISLITGTNNSGKTSFLQAISIWSELWENFHKKKTLDGNPVEMDKFELKTIEINDFKELWFKSITTNPITIRIDFEQGSLGFGIRYQGRSLVEVIPLKIHQDGQHLFQEKPIKFRYIQSLSPLDNYEPHYAPTVFQSRLARGRGGSILKSLLTVVSRDKQKWQSLQNTISDFFGYELLPPTGNDPIHASFRHSNKENSLNLSNGASGFLQVVLLHSALLQSNRETKFLIDEPDTHLHSLLKEKIYKLIQKFCEENNSQVILTSTSGELIDVACKEHNLCLPRKYPIFDNSTKIQVTKPLPIYQKWVDWNSFSTKKRLVARVIHKNSPFPTTVTDLSPPFPT